MDDLPAEFLTPKEKLGYITLTEKNGSKFRVASSDFRKLKHTVSGGTIIIYKNGDKDIVQEHQEKILELMIEAHTNHTKYLKSLF